MNDSKFLNALHGKNQDTPPIWFMRQAGRYHDHYQNLRQKHSFMELCKQPELACQVALGPVEEFGFDAAILFSDILFPLQALGFGLDYTDQGPKLAFQLDQDNIKKLASFEEAWPQLEFQKRAVELTRRAIKPDIGMIGFIGGPWTLFSYAVEGHHTGGLLETKKKLSLCQSFMNHLVPLLQKNIELQLQGGADIVMIFDTAAGELSPAVYQELAIPSLKKLIDQFPRRIGYYSKGTQAYHLNPLKKAVGKNLLGLGYDHRWELSQILKGDTNEFGHEGFVQGNFDQSFLHAPKETLSQLLKQYMEPLKSLPPEQRRRWISGLGHGVLPKTPMDNVKLFIETFRRTMS